MILLIIIINLDIKIKYKDIIKILFKSLEYIFSPINIFLLL
jgi:hypothetical protein